MKAAAESTKKIRSVKRRLRRQSLRRAAALVPVILVALVILFCAVYFPILQVFGDGMLPGMNQNDFAVVLRSRNPAVGQIIAFECDGQLLIRRVIAGPGSSVSIDTDGNVTVDGSVLEEPYLAEKAMGICSSELPLVVPEGQYFVLSDNRENSVDSRSSLIGCIPREKILGNVILVLRTGELIQKLIQEKP